MDFVVVVNANAGSAERDSVDAVRGVLGDHGGCELVETEGPEQLTEVIRSLGDRQLVVCGGDGSVHLTVELLRADDLLRDVSVGWVPLGTGNDLARTLRLPLDPEAAAAAVVAGARRKLDLIIADDGTVAVNALHAGVGVDAATRAQALKDRIGEFAYPLGAVAAGVTAEGWDLAVEVDGEPIRTDPRSNVLIVAVMNGRTFGGGTEMSPHAEPDDGSLDVVVCMPLGPAQRAAFGVALQAGRHIDREDVFLARGESVTIRGDPVGYNVDGELADREYTERSFRIEPGAWSIVAP